jgi:hypothetical protein
MELEVSLPCSQKPSPNPYTEEHDFSLQSRSIRKESDFNITLTIDLHFRSGLFLSCFQTKMR